MLRARTNRLSGGGRPGLPVPNYPYGLCGRKATRNRTIVSIAIKLLIRERACAMNTHVHTGIAQWLARRTRDRKVAGSSPGMSCGRIFFSRVNFLC